MDVVVVYVDVKAVYVSLRAMVCVGAEMKGMEREEKEKVVEATQTRSCQSRGGLCTKKDDRRR